MNADLEIDLTAMPEGKRYEDRYGAYMAIFKKIAEAPWDKKIVVVNAPWSWWPLLEYLNCRLAGGQIYFEHDHLVKKVILGGRWFDRTALEVLCGFRPECVDALWKIDMQWLVPPGRVHRSENKKDFIVTTNGSFHRPEVLDYLKQLNHFVPPTRKVVLVPCAADKPYPSPLHQAVLDRMPADFYLANVTGVLGIVPQAAWPTMPHYDSGIPNEWRLSNIAQKYFSKFPHDRVVVYADYYNEALWNAFRRIGMEDRATFVNPIKFYYDYLPLLSPEYLDQLEKVFNKERAKEIA